MIPAASSKKLSSSKRINYLSQDQQEIVSFHLRYREYQVRSSLASHPHVHIYNQKSINKHTIILHTKVG